MRTNRKKLFRDFRKIREIEIKLAKETRPWGADIDSAGVEMHCTQTESTLKNTNKMKKLLLILPTGTGREKSAHNKQQRL